MKSKLVVLTGAGISAESGLSTFRNSPDGLWNNFKIEDVCTDHAWAMDPTKVNDFYNIRRTEVLNVNPNAAHIALAEAEEYFDVQIVTTNVDDLHERAGSTNVLHLHGNLLKARSSSEGIASLNDLSVQPYLVDVGREGISTMQQHSDGSLLRPHVVFFGEDVPNMEAAIEIFKEADYLMVVGTSLEVYPAASLIFDAKKVKQSFYIDPTTDASASYTFPCIFINKNATIGVKEALTTIAKLLD